MSAEARLEAIEIVAAELAGIAGESLAQDIATTTVDKLLETHALMRRSPRRNVRAIRPQGESALDELRRSGARA